MNRFGLRLHVDCEPAQAFSALVEAVDLEIWLAEHAAVNAENGQYDFWGPSVPGVTAGDKSLIELIPGSKVSFNWRYLGVATVVDLSVASDRNGGSSVSLVHGADESFELVNDFARDYWWLSLDNLANHLEGRSISPRVDFSVPSGPAVKLAIDIDAPVAATFQALIDPNQMNRWVSKEAVVEPQVGGQYDYGWGKGPIQILNLEPDRLLEFSWNHGESENTVVRWELADSNGKTHLTLVHSGFAESKDTGDYTAGWTAFLGTLRRMLELGPKWVNISAIEPALK